MNVQLLVDFPKGLVIGGQAAESMAPLFESTEAAYVRAKWPGSQTRVALLDEEREFTVEAFIKRMEGLTK